MFDRIFGNNFTRREPQTQREISSSEQTTNDRIDKIFSSFLTFYRSFFAFSHLFSVSMATTMSFMAMPKLAEVAFYGISVLDGSLVSMFLLSTCPRLQLCRALILTMSFNPPIKRQFLRSCGLSRR